jgi:hypothetical protein
MAKRILVCWTGLGQARLPEKLEWIGVNHSVLEKTRGDHSVDYLAFCYHKEAVKLPDSIKVIYRPGIVFQYMYEELKPDTLKETYDYILLILDDIQLHADFSLSGYIDIYERNKLDVLQCALNDETVLSHEYMRHSPDNAVGRLTNMAEYFSYLMSITSYSKYYTTFLSNKTFWGWGIDINLWNVGKLRVGVLDKWPIWHRINGDSYNKSNNNLLVSISRLPILGSIGASLLYLNSLKDPHIEMYRWPKQEYKCFGKLE